MLLLPVEEEEVVMVVEVVVLEVLYPVFQD
jgi:hypothetical protein